MSCPNCKIFHAQCKAECCKFVPLPMDTVMRNDHKFQRPVEVFRMFPGDLMIPVTEGLSCVFLTHDLSCAIYDERPEVCQKFGDESALQMTCCYQKKTGEARNSMERKRIHKEQMRDQNKILGK